MTSAGGIGPDLPRPRRLPVGRGANLAVPLVLLSITSANLGSVVSVHVFTLVTPAGLVGLRNLFGALILLAVSRPNLRQLSAKGWLAIGLFGVAIAAMNSLFFEAIKLVPVGPAVTVEMLGPLVLSAVLAKRPAAWLWAALALVGVVAIRGFGSSGGLNAAGLALAAGAGVAWAGYILCSRWSGRLTTSVDAVALATAAAALITVPRGLVMDHVNMLKPEVLAWGLAVAALSNAVAHGVEIVALRRMPAHIFSVMMALAPVVASLLGWALAGQRLTIMVIAGMALVVAATMAATLTDRSRRPPRTLDG